MTWRLSRASARCLPSMCCSGSCSVCCKTDANALLLAPIYGWFTEGFETAALQEARALLAALL